MDLIKNWKLIKTHFAKSILSNLHVSIASVNHENMPTVTPIGTLFLNDDQTGFYFEEYTNSLPGNSKFNRHICVLAVNSNWLFWVKSLYSFRFNYPAGLKLYGKLGERRRANDQELSRLRKRLKPFKVFRKSYDELWGNMKFVREIKFEKCENLHFGKLTPSYI